MKSPTEREDNKAKKDHFKVELGTFRSASDLKFSFSRWMLVLLLPGGIV
jgi:hypothetical protein